MDPKVRHLLKLSVQQGPMFQEVACSLQAVNQELVSLKQTPALAMIPLPNPSHNAQGLLSKLNMDDNIEAFLGTFKRVAERKGW